MKSATKTTETNFKRQFFLADCDYFGYIEPGIFKEVEIPYDKNCTSIMRPFEYDYTKAINSLHEWILENDGIANFPKAKWSIYLVDGSMNKYEEIKTDKVYSISSTKAKKLLLN